MVETVVTDLNLPREIGKKNPAVKRKRDNQIRMSMIPGERKAKIGGLNEEFESLIKYFKELASYNGVAAFTESQFQIRSSGNLNATIAVLLEERNDPYSKLSSEIFEKLKERDSTITIANVKSNVLNIGRRVCYGVQIDEGDVLEDETETCLWCWKTRDMKLLPTAIREAVKVRRTCRRKISERITAISAILSLLRNPMDCQSYNNDLRKASDKLYKLLNEADIRLVAQSSTKFDGSETADKSGKKEEKFLIKQLEKIKREKEKEKKRMDRERQRKSCKEKDLRRLQEEAERDEKRREKEESEMRKQLKRKQEELERDHRRWEKEEADQKRQCTVQKQASIMQRFLHLSRNNSASRNDRTSRNATTSDLSYGSENKQEPATLFMYCVLEDNKSVTQRSATSARSNRIPRQPEATESSRQHNRI